MKKVFWLILAGIALLAILFVPIPGESYDDGGTREFRALTYKIVDWNKLSADGSFDEPKIYWMPDNFKSIDQLWEQEQSNAVYRFTATIIEVGVDAVLVEEADGTQISFATTSLEDINPTPGMDVTVSYKGGRMESYPIQVQATAWEIAGDLRHKAYTDAWLDPETAEQTDHLFAHITITKIYENCFFARSAIPMPYEIKVNGQLSQDWCVGDQVECTFANIWQDDHSRIECDLVSIAQSDWAPEPGVAYKPVIYLYPREQTQVSVKLDIQGKLTCTYPAYGDGWQVTAAPDGTLTDGRGQTYNYLYWEGDTYAQWDMQEGFCIKGEDTAAFLEDALAKLGLNRKEANEFIVYWLPLMEQNPYNIIAFQTDAYTQAARLQIEPAPDTVIRVFMTWQASEDYVNLQAQSLTAPERTGFTVVEWGGTQID